MTLDKLVSVLIPCYNCEKYIKLSLKSILDQTYKNLEILVTDDCSTDNTYNILLEESKKDTRIKVFRNDKNLKIVETLNNMVRIAQGDYLVRMDADDISDLNRIEKQISFLERNKEYDFCGSNALIINEGNSIVGKTDLPIEYNNIYNMQKYYSAFNHPSMCFRKNVLKGNLYSSDYPYAEDYELWTRLLYQKKYKAANLKDNLLYYRIFPNQSSSKYRNIQVESVMKIMTDYKVVSNENIYLHSALISAKEIKNYDKTELLIFLKQYFNEISVLEYNYPVMIRYFLFCCRNRLIKPLIIFVFSIPGGRTFIKAVNRKICKIFKTKRVKI